MTAVIIRKKAESSSTYHIHVSRISPLRGGRQQYTATAADASAPIVAILNRFLLPKGIRHSSPAMMGIRIMSVTIILP